MIRATTPIHTFTFTINPNTLSKLLITYKQGLNIVLEKDKDDLTFTSETVEGVVYYYGAYQLTQAETKLFNASEPVYIQVRALTTTGQALASEIISQTVTNVLNDEVLE